MIKRIKFDEFGGYWWDALNGIKEFERFTTPFRIESYTLGALYDPNKYELVEKKDFAEKRVKELTKGLDEEIATLERNRDSTAKYYTNAIARLKEERERLIVKTE